jgi:hypothetical protein
VRLFLHFASSGIFGNYKVGPLLSSISVLVLTYCITKEITKKRFAGLVAFVLVLQSGTFLIYDTSIIYDSYWVSFYLLSLYVIFKKWPVSPIAFVLSLLCKHLSVVFAPMTLFVAYNSDLARKSKILLTAAYAGILGVGFFITNGFTTQSIQTTSDWHDFWMALSGISYQMRYDVLILVFLLPVILALFVAAKRNIVHAKSAMILMLGSLLSQPILSAFTVNSSEPYRFLPFVVFFAISCGVLFSKTRSDE